MKSHFVHFSLIVRLELETGLCQFLIIKLTQRMRVASRRKNRKGNCLWFGREDSIHPHRQPVNGQEQ
jgi:hypothetical protein